MLNIYEVFIDETDRCVTPPLRCEEEAITYAKGWFVETGSWGDGLITSVTLLKRGVVPHDLSSGTSEQ